MNNKIGRNDLCPCKSGKKYKKCHGNIQDQPVLDPKIPLESAMKKRINESRIKHCIHPNKSECSVNIIRAHSIQNNRILTRIGEKGEVYMVKASPTKIRMKYNFKRVGRSVATTFTGFCGKHDTNLFLPVEVTDYSGTDQQKFMFAYRAFSFEYHKKLEAHNAHKKLGDTKPSLMKSDQYLDLAEGYDLGINDSLRHKGILDDALLNSKYDIIETVEISFDGHATIAVCSGFYLEYDIKGNQLNRLDDPKTIMKILLLNIFPQDDKMHVLFSWLKEDDAMYQGFKDQLLSLSKNEQLQMLNNMIPAYSENTVYNPTFIDAWSEKEKKQYLWRFEGTAMEVLSDTYIKSSLLNKTDYNLFQGIQT
ncbi:YecA family protein [Paenibacillus sp. GCM10027626]|uniref:YecA family protein n=1 Tax=Paenibacillus sp. GCM10027626 TaxID=3273411 RepID=UPI00364097F6